MRDQLNQFVENVQGQFIEVSSKSAIYQCMDLAYLWVFCLGFPKSTIQHTYAYEVFTKPTETTKEYFDLISNTPDFVPQDGDIAVWKGGEAGHIAICLSGSTKTKLLVFEQNNPLGSNARISERTYTNVLGFLRPKIKSANPDWLKQMYLERGIDLNLSEGEIRYRIQEIFDSAKRTEELKKQVGQLSTRLEEAEGEVKRLETASANDIKQIKQLNTDVEDLRRQVVNRDTQITSLQTQLNDLQSQISPDKVVVLTREEYARLSATKTLDKFTGWELLKEFLRRVVKK